MIPADWMLDPIIRNLNEMYRFNFLFAYHSSNARGFGLKQTNPSCRLNMRMRGTLELFAYVKEVCDVGY